MNDKLIAIQQALKAPKSQYNSFSNYKYRNAEDILNALKPLLKEHALTLVLTDEVVNIGSHNYVKADAILQDGTNKTFVSAYAREEVTLKGQIAAQITGGASSYARKYALNGMFLIDDSQDPDSQDNTPKLVKKKPESNLATDAQRKVIADKLAPIGFNTPAEIKNYLSTEYGINGLLTKEDASIVIEDLKSMEVSDEG